MPAETCLAIALLVGAQLTASARMESQGYNPPPFFQTDALIDKLGAESNIHSIRDVDKYVDALVHNYKAELSLRFGLINADLIPFESIKSRIAAAEYRAVSDHSERIPEEVVANVFNQLMADWNTPSWTRISLEELHQYRILLASTRYPTSVARSDDGGVSDSCRPVESVLLLYRLERNGGVPSGLREVLKSGKLNYSPGNAIPTGVYEARLVASETPSDEMRLNSQTYRTAALKRAREYTTARDAYFSAHPETDPKGYFAHILDLLHIN